jgi:hypothetical protein
MLAAFMRVGRHMLAAHMQAAPMREPHTQAAAHTAEEGIAEGVAMLAVAATAVAIAKDTGLSLWPNLREESAIP